MRENAEQTVASMTIGKLSRATGVSIDSIRFYEKSGLLPKAVRRASGYREYSQEDERRLEFVCRARELGFSLGEIGSLMKLRAQGPANVAKVRKVAQAKLAVVDAKIEQLRKLRTALASLVTACPGSGDPNECPILNAFSNGGAT